MKSKPILQIIDSLRVGGAQRLLITFAEQMEEQERPLTVITLRDDHDSFMVDLLEKLGVTVYQLPGKKLLDQSRWKKLYQLIQEESYQIIHTHLSYANILGAVAGWRLGIPVIATLHNVRAAKQSTLARLAETAALRYFVDEITAVGTLVTEAQKGRFPKRKIVTIANAVSPIPEMSEEERTDFRKGLPGCIEDEILLLSVGRLTEQKGFADLIDAFALVQKSVPETRLFIAGGGELKERLEEQIEQLGLVGTAHLLGLRDDIFNLLAAADLFISSSHWEGLPVALLEGMSAGLPIVATDVGAVAELAVAGTGMIVPPKEADKLAKAILKMIDNREEMKEMGRVGQKHVAANYSAAAWAEIYLQLYRSVKERYE